MTKVAGKNQERIARRQVDKFAERRAQLAATALQTLSELGYARTSLRDIAQNSEFSHGVLHYYFNDKVDLIIESVKQYKAECVKRYDEIVATARTALEIKYGFSAASTRRRGKRLSKTCAGRVRGATKRSAHPPQAQR